MCFGIWWFFSLFIFLPEGWGGYFRGEGRDLIIVQRGEYMCFLCMDSKGGSTCVFLCCFIVLTLCENMVRFMIDDYYYFW